MNANELADKLEKDGEGCTCCAYCAGECACDANWAEYHTKEAAIMLRQQQAEIEALKKFSRWAYKNLTQTALQYELLGGRSEFDVNELWKLLEEKK